MMMSFTRVSDGSLSSGSQFFSNVSFTSTPSKNCMAFPQPFICLMRCISRFSFCGLSAYFSHSRLILGVTILSLNICSCRNSGGICSSKLKSTIPFE
ncbi:Uncharacterised protein [Segatella copri]|nr:Uncharacterised protein [Segatella copri]